MENVATTHSFALFARFLHFHENNDLKVPERSKNGPKKVPILSQRPKFCLCSDFSRQVPNPKSYIGAPESGKAESSGLSKIQKSCINRTCVRYSRLSLDTLQLGTSCIWAVQMAGSCKSWSAGGSNLGLFSFVFTSLASVCLAQYPPYPCPR